MFATVFVIVVCVILSIALIGIIIFMGGVAVAAIDKLLTPNPNPKPAPSLLKWILGVGISFILAIWSFEHSKTLIMGFLETGNTDLIPVILMGDSFIITCWIIIIFAVSEGEKELKDRQNNKKTSDDTE